MELTRFLAEQHTKPFIATGITIMDRVVSFI